MLWKIKARLDLLIRQLTYRQKFLFLAVVFILSSYTPAYWLFSRINTIYQQNALKIQGLSLLQELNRLGVNLARFQIQSHVSPQSTQLAHLQEAMSGSISAIHSISQEARHLSRIDFFSKAKSPSPLPADFFKSLDQDWHHFIQSSSEQQKNLIQPLFNAIQEQLIATNIAFYVSLREEALAFRLTNDLETTILQNIRQLPVLYEKKVLLNDNLLKNSLFRINKHLQFFSLKNENSIEVTLLLSTFTNVLNDTRLFLQSVENEPNIFYAMRSLNSFERYIEASHAYILQSIQAQQTWLTYYWIALVTLICFGTFHALFYSFFHVLSRHILILRDYIEQMMNGRFDFPLTINHKDSLGKVGIAICNMAKTLGSFVLQLDVTGEQIQDFVKKTSQTVLQQQQTLSKQEQGFNELKSIQQKLAEHSEELHGYVSQILHKSAIASPKKARNLGEIRSDIQDLMAISFFLLELLQELERESNAAARHLHTISGISNEAHSLSLNASIEVLYSQTTENANFKQIKQNINLFAQSTATATEEIHTIIHDISHQAKHAYEITKNCLSKIDTTLQRFLLASQELEVITEQGGKQEGIFQDISEIMVRHLEAVNKTQHICSKLQEESEHYSLFIQNIKQALQAFEESLQKFYGVIQRFSLRGRLNR